MFNPLVHGQERRGHPAGRGNGWTNRDLGSSRGTRTPRPTRTSGFAIADFRRTQLAPPGAGPGPAPRGGWTDLSASMLRVCTESAIPAEGHLVQALRTRPTCFASRSLMRDW
jgi:hypothetical protein